MSKVPKSSRLSRFQKKTLKKPKLKRIRMKMMMMTKMTLKKVLMMGHAKTGRKK